MTNTFSPYSESKHDYRYDIGMLADWLLKQGYLPVDRNQGAILTAIHIISEQKKDIKTLTDTNRTLLERLARMENRQ